VAKHLDKPEVRTVIEALPAAFDRAGAPSTANLETALRSHAEHHGMKGAALIHATRVAVTGRAVSPGLFEVLELLGPDRVRARIHGALNFLRK
jgi:glutamyl/glutaminyl-tRNA synthetase